MACWPLISTAVKSNLSAVIKQQNIDIVEVDEHLTELSDALRTKIVPGFEEYGLTIPQFYLTNIVLPEGDPNFRRVFEADADATFLELHEAILKSVGYPDNQMTSFFLCNDEWEKGQEVTLVEMDSNFEYDNMVMNETRLSDLIEEQGQRLIYIFDPMFER